MAAAVALDSTMGALLLAVIASAVIYGVNCLQTYIYFTEASKEDRIWLKLFVSDTSLDCGLQSDKLLTTGCCTTVSSPRPERPV
jgi:hypothetical protein